MVSQNKAGNKEVNIQSEAHKQMKVPETSIVRRNHEPGEALAAAFSFRLVVKQVILLHVK